MNRFNLTAFNDRVQVPTGGSLSVVTSSANHAAALGMFDQIAFVVTAEQISGDNPTLGVRLQHSADGRNWLDKPGTSNMVPDTTILDPDGQQVFLGFDDGTIPTLRLVRFVIALGGTGPLNVAVRIDATLNDVRQSVFARKMFTALSRQTVEAANQCQNVLQGGSPVPGTIAGQAGIAQLAGTPAEGSLSNMFVPDGQGGFTVAPDARVCVNAKGGVTVNTPHGSFHVQAPAAAGPEGSSSGSTSC